MRRWLLKVGVFVLAGAIVNVAVAWGCILSGNAFVLANVHRPPTGDECERWERDAPPGFSEKPASVHHVEYFGWGTLDSWGDMDGRLTAAGEGGFRIDGFTTDDWMDRGVELHAGWPSMALRGHTWQRAHVGTNRVITERQSLWRWPWNPMPWSSIFREVWLPFQPLSPGFAINTIFYAAILWVLFAVPRRIRRWRRMKRGLCPACGYPMGESSICTECGNTLNPPQAQT